MGGLKRVTLNDVHKAAERLRPILSPTPLVYSHDRDAWLKLENLQFTGAYKVRGALNALLIQIQRNDRRTVIAASAGNHGAGVAWAARHVGLEAIIVVPVHAPRSKVDRIRQLGAKVVFMGETFEGSLKWAQYCARQHGFRLLHAFDDPDVIAGQGTVALELLDLQPDVVLIPIGGGGLAAGTSLVLKDAGIRAVGVQIKGVDALASYLRGGPVRIRPKKTIADGLRVRESGHITRELCEQNLSQVVLVTESEVQSSMQSLETCEPWSVEGAGAVSVAALTQVVGLRRVALITGGNRDTAPMMNDQRKALLIN
ncbi:MAG: serine/threonine dehydratase [Deltaproteobacteria bacterium]|mgnify:CR=1 FL=1|nr:serine/threonine dehydratase [Deltaproteobacteria bacterium]|tara:strand:+ start:405 stop:1343 length:939 start_codon:yes stop_codon:yes gene_type:complete